MKNLPKTFEKDGIARNSSGKPAARIVLAGSYLEGANIAVAIMEIPNGDKEFLKGSIYYIDGNIYRVPKDIPDVRFTVGTDKIIINNFYLERIKILDDEQQS